MLLPHRTSDKTGSLWHPSLSMWWRLGFPVGLSHSWVPQKVAASMMTPSSSFFLLCCLPGGIKLPHKWVKVLWPVNWKNITDLNGKISLIASTLLFQVAKSLLRVKCALQDWSSEGKTETFNDWLWLRKVWNLLEGFRTILKWQSLKIGLHTHLVLSVGSCYRSRKSLLIEQNKFLAVIQKIPFFFFWVHCLFTLSNKTPD